MTNQQTAQTYLADTRLDSPVRLAEALGLCGAVLDVWSVNELTVSRLRRFQSLRTRRRSYVEFDVPKKTGGVRRISAPVAALKKIQQALSLMLQAVCRVSDQANGFVPGRSVVNNARPHAGQKVVFNCDLRDFFPSISRAMVRRALEAELAPLHPSAEVLSMICSLVTAPQPDGTESLPQGAPTSPVVSNLVMKALDSRLSGFAEANGYRYTRYADDITLSHSHPDGRMLPEKIEAVYSIITDCGFAINPRKTRVYTTSGRMEVTGLTVNGAVNVGRRYMKSVRALLHLWETRGYAGANAIYRRDFCGGGGADIAKVVNGKINYLTMVRDRDCPACRRLKSRYRRLMRALKESEKET